MPGGSSTLNCLLAAAAVVGPENGWVNNSFERNHHFPFPPTTFCFMVKMCENKNGLKEGGDGLWVVVNSSEEAAVGEEERLHCLRTVPVNFTSSQE